MLPPVAFASMIALRNVVTELTLTTVPIVTSQGATEFACTSVMVQEQGWACKKENLKHKQKTISEA